MKLIVNIACDDIHPQEKYCVLGEQTEKWFRQLNDEFGAKFDLFVPSNWHGQYPLTSHKGWIQELDSVEYFSLNCHGHFHQCNNPKQYGEMEMFEPNPESSTQINAMLREWHESVGYYPEGFRSPGWMINQENKELIEKIFGYVAVHYEHNHGMNWECKTFFGHDGIQQENIGIHNISDDGQIGMIMFQSHIAGVHNHNVWNQNNFDQLRLSLSHLVEQYECEFKTLKECL